MKLFTKSGYYWETGDFWREFYDEKGDRIAFYVIKKGEEIVYFPAREPDIDSVSVSRDDIKKLGLETVIERMKALASHFEDETIQKFFVKDVVKHLKIKRLCPPRRML